jgi:hypothetical protein
VPTLQDILKQLTGGGIGTSGSRGYGSEVPRYNAFEQAPLLANAVVQFQKEQRTAPYIQALQDYGRQYGAATDDAGRQRANAAANQARAAFISAGGSPLDLPRNLWGSSPDQGFQTGDEEFKPSYFGDNLSYGQRERQAALKRQAEMDALQRRVSIAGLTGIDPETNQPTWEREYQLKALENRLAGGGGGGSRGGLTAYQQNQIDAKAKAELNADKAALGNQLSTGKLSREKAIDTILKQYQAGIIDFDYANELLKTVDVFAPLIAEDQQSNGNASLNPMSPRQRSTLEDLTDLSL